MGSITTTSNPDFIFAQGGCGPLWYDVSDKANPHLASLHYTKGGLSGLYSTSDYSTTSGGDIVAVFPNDNKSPGERDYVVLYSADTREVLAAINVSTSAGHVNDVAVHNNLLFVVGRKGFAVVNATTGTVAFSAPFFPSGSYGYGCTVKVSPEAKLLYTFSALWGKQVGTVTVRSLDTFALLSSFEHASVDKILTPTGSPTEVYILSYIQLTKVDVADPANPVVRSRSVIIPQEGNVFVSDIVWTDVLVIATSSHRTEDNTEDPPDEVRVLDPLNGFSITARSNIAVDLSDANLAVGDTGIIYCMVNQTTLVVFEQQGSDLVMSGQSEPSIVGRFYTAVEIEPDVIAVSGTEGISIVDMHYPIPKVLATEKTAGNEDFLGLCVSRKHSLLFFQEEQNIKGQLSYHLVAYDVSDPAAPALVWRKQQQGVDLVRTCVATEDVVLLTLYDTSDVEVIDVTTGQKTDTVVVDDRQKAGVSRGYLFFSSEGDMKAYHISESLQAEPLPDLLINSSTGNFAYGTDTSMCVAQYDSNKSKPNPGPLSIFMYDTQRDSDEVEEPVQQLHYTNATMSLLSGQTMVVQDFSGEASMMLIYDTSTSPITLSKAVKDEELVYPTLVMGDTFYIFGGRIVFYNPAPATPAPVTPAPATPVPVPDTSAAGVPWLVVVGSVVFFAAAAFAGGWFLKSKMKVREVDQNSGLRDQIVDDNVQEVE